MSDTTPEGRFGSPGKGPRKSAPNVSGGWLVMVLSGLIAVVVFLFVTQGSSNTTAITVLSRDVVGGTPITAADLRQVNVNLPGEQLSHAISFSDRQAVEGYIATTSLKAGDILQRSNVVAPAAPNGLRAMSIPNDRLRAVAGALQPGDRVDVVDESQDTTNAPYHFVAVDMQVLAITNSGGGIAGGGGNFAVTVAVRPEQADRVSRAINTNQKFDIVRSTGAAQIAGAQYGSPATSGSNAGSSTTTTAAP